MNISIQYSVSTQRVLCEYSESERNRTHLVLAVLVADSLQDVVDDATLCGVVEKGLSVGDDETRARQRCGYKCVKATCRGQRSL